METLHNPSEPRSIHGKTLRGSESPMQHQPGGAHITGDGGKENVRNQVAQQSLSSGNCPSDFVPDADERGVVSEVLRRLISSIEARFSSSTHKSKPVDGPKQHPTQQTSGYVPGLPVAASACHDNPTTVLVSENPRLPAQLGSAKAIDSTDLHDSMSSFLAQFVSEQLQQEDPDTVHSTSTVSSLALPTSSQLTPQQQRSTIQKLTHSAVANDDSIEEQSSSLLSLSADISPATTITSPIVQSTLSLASTPEPRLPSTKRKISAVSAPAQSSSLLELGASISPVPNEIFAIDGLHSPKLLAPSSKSKPEQRVLPLVTPDVMAAKRKKVSKPQIPAIDVSHQVAPISKPITPKAPVVVVVHWGQCDKCEKWRIVRHELDADAPFICSDVVGKACSDPEDELPANTVSAGSSLQSAAAAAAAAETSCSQALPDCAKPPAEKQTFGPDADILNVLLSEDPVRRNVAQDETTVFEDLFVHKIQRMLAWKEGSADTAEALVNKPFPCKFLDPFAAQLMAMRRVETEQSLTSENRDLIARFLGHLDHQVFAGLGVCALHDLYTKKSETVAKSKISAVMSALSAAVASLEIMAVRFEEAQFVFLDDDRILSAINVCKHNLLKHGFPVFDEAFRHHLLTAAERKGAGAEAPGLNKTSKSKCPSSFDLGQGATKKVVRDMGRRVCVFACHILDILKHLALKVTFPDTAVSQLVAVCISTFSADSVEFANLQLCAQEVIRSIFAAYRGSRVLISSDVIAFVALTPLPKRIPRRFLTIHPRIEIQVVSALILQLIQSCSQRREKQAHLPFRALMKEPQRIAIQLCNVLLRQCIQLDDKEKAKSAQKTVDNLVSDILNIYNRPEWPGAGVLVQHFAQTLQKYIKKLNCGTGSKNKTNFHHFPAINFLLRVFGDIYRRVKVDMVERSSIQLDLSISKFRIDGRPCDEDEDNTCICGKECLATRDDRPEDMLDCDQCHKWFHLKCFGITNAAALRTWKCDTCLVRSATTTIMKRIQARKATAAAKAKLAAESALEQQSEKHGDAIPKTNQARKQNLTRNLCRKPSKISLSMLNSDDEDEELDDENMEPAVSKAGEMLPETSKATQQRDLKRQLLLNYVTDLGRSHPVYEHLRAFYLDKWACIDAYHRSKTDASPTGLFFDPDLQREAPLLAPGTVDEAVLSPLKSFIISRDLGLDELSAGINFDGMAGVLFDAFMDAGSQTIRASATKAIASVAHIDPEMLGRTQFKWLINQTLNDPSISVRHNIIEALGNCIATTTVLSTTDDHVVFLLKKLSDPGVTVRKAVVKILRLLLMRRQHHPKRPQIIKQLLQRYQFAETEDSIKDLILDCIAQLWFRQKLHPKSKTGTQSDELSGEQNQIDFVEPILAKIDEFHTTSIARLNADIARLPDGWSQERGSDVKWNSAVVYRSPRGRMCRTVIQALHIARLEQSEDAAEATSSKDNAPLKRGRLTDDGEESSSSEDDTSAISRRSSTSAYATVVDELVEVAESISPEWLPLIIKTLWRNEVASSAKEALSSSAKPVVRDTKIMQTCRKIVAHLVKAAHSCELQVREVDRADRTTFRKRARQQTDAKASHLNRLRMIFTLLSRFCLVSRQLLVPYIGEFAMYLDEDDILGHSHNETFIVFHFIKIVGLCAPQLASAPDAGSGLATSMLAKLQKLIFKSQTRELVVASIDALCQICHARRHSAPIFSIMTKFYRYLDTKRTQCSDGGVCLNARRALLGLGFFSLHGKFREKAAAAARKRFPSSVLEAALSTKTKPLDINQKLLSVATSGLTIDNVIPAVYDITVFYALQFGSPLKLGVQQDAIEGLIAFFSAAPGYIIRQASGRVITSGLCSPLFSMRAATLRFLANMLDLEEKRVSGKDAFRDCIDEELAKVAQLNTSAPSIHNNLIGAAATDHHCFTDGLRSHTETVHHLLLDDSAQVKLAALQLQTLLLRQGLVDPSRSVAIFIAMQCDLWHDVASQSLSLLKNANAGLGGGGAVKGGNINAHCLHGIALAFQRQLYGSKSDTRVPCSSCAATTSASACFATFNRKSSARGNSRSRTPQRRTRGDDCNVKNCYSFLGPLYDAVLRTSDRRRMEFFEICVSAFKHTENLLFLAKAKRTSSKKKKSKGKFPTQFNAAMACFDQSLRPLYLRFLTATLAMLPFELEEEVVELVLVMNQVLSVHATPIKDDIKRLLDRTELAFDRPPRQSESNDDVLFGSEKWKKSDVKKVAAAFGYLQLVRLKSFLLARYRLDEGKFVGSSQKLGKSTVKRKAIPVPSATQVLQLSSLEVLRKVSALTGTQSGPGTHTKPVGCAQIVVSELRCFLKEMRDDVLIVTATHDSGDPSDDGAGADMNETEAQ